MRIKLLSHLITAVAFGHLPTGRVVVVDAHIQQV